MKFLYEAFDGKQFTDIETCQKYEMNISLEKIEDPGQIAGPFHYGRVWKLCQLLNMGRRILMKIPSSPEGKDEFTLEMNKERSRLMISPKNDKYITEDTIYKWLLLTKSYEFFIINKPEEHIG
jgi:hypothetical protein